MQIQQVERQTGLSAQNIRFYEREGLIQPERNPENRYRNYTEEDVRRLNSIAFCRSMGIPISAIRRVLVGEVSLQNCVEDALLDAKTAEAEAHQRAELCRCVLEELQNRPQLPLDACVSAIMTVPPVRRLYAQVLPPEARKPKNKRNYLFWIPAVVCVLIGVLVIGSVASVATFRTQRNTVLRWLTAADTRLTFAYGETVVPEASPAGEYLKNRLGDLLLEPSPTEVLPFRQAGTHPLVVTMTGEQGEAELVLEQLEEGFSIQWRDPEDSFYRVVRNRHGKTILRQMREAITP